MSKPTFIAGDWGSSNLRLYLCSAAPDQAAQLLDTRHGPGVLAMEGDFEDKFFDLANDWLRENGALPIILSGMVSSNLGWKETTYLTCPLSSVDIAAGVKQFTARGHTIWILQGVSTTNPFGLNDVMRGETLQVLGWLQHASKNGDGQHLLTFPGTHNKWVLMQDAQLKTFLTAFTGELFGLLRSHSTLSEQAGTFDFDHEAFMLGVQTLADSKGRPLLNTLFSVRSRQVLGELVETQSLSYLLGQLVAADVLSALDAFPNIQSITVIGEQKISDQYESALKHFDREVICVNSDQIAVNGFGAVYGALQINS